MKPYDSKISISFITILSMMIFVSLDILPIESAPISASNNMDCLITKWLRMKSGFPSSNCEIKRKPKSYSDDRPRVHAYVIQRFIQCLLHYEPKLANMFAIGHRENRRNNKQAILQRMQNRYKYCDILRDFFSEKLQVWPINPKFDAQYIEQILMLFFDENYDDNNNFTSLTTDIRHLPSSVGKVFPPIRPFEIDEVRRIFAAPADQRLIRYAYNSANASQYWIEIDLKLSFKMLANALMRTIGDDNYQITEMERRRLRTLCRFAVEADAFPTYRSLIYACSNDKTLVPMCDQIRLLRPRQHSQYIAFIAAVFSREISSSNQDQTSSSSSSSGRPARLRVKFAQFLNMLSLLQPPNADVEDEEDDNNLDLQDYRLNDTMAIHLAVAKLNKSDHDWSWRIDSFYRAYQRFSFTIEAANAGATTNTTTTTTSDCDISSIRIELIEFSYDRRREWFRTIWHNFAPKFLLGRKRVAASSYRVTESTIPGNNQTIGELVSDRQNCEAHFSLLIYSLSLLGILTLLTPFVNQFYHSASLRVENGSSGMAPTNPVASDRRFLPILLLLLLPILAIFCFRRFLAALSSRRAPHDENFKNVQNKQNLSPPIKPTNVANDQKPISATKFDDRSTDTRDSAAAATTAAAASASAKTVVTDNSNLGSNAVNNNNKNNNNQKNINIITSKRNDDDNDHRIKKWAILSAGNQVSTISKQQPPQQQQQQQPKSSNKTKLIQPKNCVPSGESGKSSKPKPKTKPKYDDPENASCLIQNNNNNYNHGSNESDITKATSTSSLPSSDVDLGLTSAFSS